MKKSTIAKRIAVVAVVAGVIVAFKVLGLGQYFTLSYVKASQEKFVSLYAEHRLPVIASYMTVYILVTALSLPGAAVMTLAGGALFGLLTGTIMVSFASTAGATLACAVSRFMLRDWVQSRFGEKLKVINEGFEKEGAFYLFTLRLIPLFPFFVINLVMGLTKMPLAKYYWVSQLGMLPATVVYVNAGTELAKIESLSGILSPRLLISFALLGIFPLMAKKVIQYYRGHKQKPV